jgi:DNA-binding SARP family transcriptional activator/tetratricopeptide (TPR) repeat protein
MEFRVLGEVEAWVGDRRVDVGHARQRCVLAVLLVNANRIVTVDQLLARVWAEDLPHRARPVLRNYLSRLRTLLSPGGVAIERRPGGYALLVDPDDVDVHRFHRLVGEARTAADEDALGLFEEALGLWRGEPFGSLDCRWLDNVRAGLERERTAAQLDYVDVALRRGQHTRLLPALSTVAGENPLDERVAGQLMLALYRSGRQADALEHYQRTRRRLAEELGTDPSPPLRQLYHRILAADPDLAEPASTATASSGAAPRPSAMFSMRPDIPTFSGRHDEMGVLLDTVRTVLDGAVRAIAIHAVDGMAGVGKTVFSVHAAHHLAARFPDGQLFVELHGHTPGHRPVPPGDALDSLLRAAGVDPKMIPPKVDDRARLWRDRMAGKNILLVLDDAAGHDQVRPLLPGTAGSLVLVTSRHRLPALDGVQPLTLDVLTPDQSMDLLRRLADSAGDRYDEHALAEIITRCGHLPLALSLAGAQLRGHPRWTARYLADLLAAEHDRLEHLRAGDRSVAAAFTMSYRHLPTEQQRLFRLLGAHPGPEIDAFATAALADLPLAEARRQLEALHTDHLIEETAPGRYHLHDLMRAYARTLTGDDDQHALDRVLTYYCHAVQAANTHLPAYQTVTIPLTTNRSAELPRFDGEADVQAWFTTELPTLTTCVTHAAGGTGRHHVHLAALLQPFLRLNGYTEQALRINQVVLAAVDPTDQVGQAITLTNLAVMQRLLGELETAVQNHTRALELSVTSGDRLGEANSLAELGYLRYLRGEPETAKRDLGRALELHTELGDRLGQANSLTCLGLVHSLRGEYDVAPHRLDRALELYTALDNRLGQATALHELGYVRSMRGEYEAATVHHTRGLALNIALGDRHGQFNSLNELGYVLCMQGRFEEAYRNATRALELSTTLGNRVGQANSHNCLGRAQRMRGRLEAAVDHYTRALELYSTAGVRWGEANALNDLGCVLCVQGRFEEAYRNHTRALELYTTLGERDGQAEALNYLGDLAMAHPAAGDPHAYYSRALTIARDIGSSPLEAHALAGQGRCLLTTPDTDVAVALLRQAHALYRSVNSPEAAQLEHTLAALAEPRGTP